MPRRPITRLVDLCSDIGVEHIQVTELFRRIDRETAAGNDVIVQEFGTFYRKFNSARIRVLNGETINVPANDRTALRGQRFPSEAVEFPSLLMQLIGQVDGETQSVTIHTMRSRPETITLPGGVSATFSFERSATNEDDVVGTGLFENYSDRARIEVSVPSLPNGVFTAIPLTRQITPVVTQPDDNTIVAESDSAGWRPGGGFDGISLLFSESDIRRFTNFQARMRIVDPSQIPDGALDDDGFPS